MYWEAQRKTVHLCDFGNYLNGPYCEKNCCADRERLAMIFEGHASLNKWYHLLSLRWAEHGAVLLCRFSCLAYWGYRQQQVNSSQNKGGKWFPRHLSSFISDHPLIPRWVLCSKFIYILIFLYDHLNQTREEVLSKQKDEGRLLPPLGLSQCSVRKSCGRIVFPSLG